MSRAEQLYQRAHELRIIAALTEDRDARAIVMTLALDIEAMAEKAEKDRHSKPTQSSHAAVG
jgi:hypothetical protein